MRRSALLAGMAAPALLAWVPLPGVRAAEAAPASAPCVAIGTPDPARIFTYETVVSGGPRTTYTEQWESVTQTGSRARTTRQGNQTIQENRHRIENEVALLERSSRLSPSGSTLDTTRFAPPLVMDPVSRACAGREWKIAPATARYSSGQQSASAMSPAGTLRIVAIREKVTVPAGTFETVHYIRTSQSVDEYWKSIEHGVIVRHVGRLPQGTVSQTLLSIR